MNTGEVALMGILPFYTSCSNGQYAPINVHVTMALLAA
jgi:hypothetical protein